MDVMICAMRLGHLLRDHSNVSQAVKLAVRMVHSSEDAAEMIAGIDDGLARPEPPQETDRSKSHEQY